MQVLIDYNEKNRRYAVGEFTPPQAQRVAPNRSTAMQEARDLDEALDIARNLFAGSEEEASESSFGRGYRRAAPLPFTDARQEPDVQGKKY